MGCSGADLANIMNEAAIMAVRASSNVVTDSHLSEAVDKVLVGIKSTKKVTKKRKNMVAYHEAGHALVGMLVGGPDYLRKVTIIPRGDTGGVTMFSDHEDGIVSKTYLENKIMVALGGTIAEEISLGGGEITNGATSDLKQVQAIAKAMVKDFGMGKSKLLTEDEIQSEMKLVVDTLYKKTRSLIVAYSDKLEMIKRELVEKETLSGKECYEILQVPSLRD
jgi:cell division protease FtsH